MAAKGKYSQCPFNSVEAASYRKRVVKNGLVKVSGNTRNHLLHVSGWAGSCREHTSKANHNTDFHWYLTFLHLESLFFEAANEHPDPGPTDQTGQIQLSVWTRPGQCTRLHFIPAVALQGALLPLQPLQQPGLPAASAVPKREAQGCCQKSRAHPQTARVHAALCTLLYPIMGSLLAALTREAPRGAWGNITGRSRQSSEL